MQEVERKVSKALYATAFVLAVLIFLAGMVVGYYIDLANIDSLSGETALLSQRVASVQLLYLLDDSPDLCPVYRSELNAIDVQMQKLGHKLTFMESEKMVFDGSLKKEYFILETESYLLSKKVRGLCDDNFTVLLYFYSNAGCDSCPAQGDEILKARDALLSERTVKIYSFDGDIGSPVAEALMGRYNVSSYPAIVIEGDAYPGYRDADNLTAVLRGYH